MAKKKKPELLWTRPDLFFGPEQREVATAKRYTPREVGTELSAITDV
jgi:hypothetical protein